MQAASHHSRKEATALKPPTPSPASTPPGRTEGQVAVAGGGGEEGFALVEGHEQQVGLAGLVPEDALAVDPGGVACEAAESALVTNR